MDPADQTPPDQTASAAYIPSRTGIIVPRRGPLIILALVIILLAVITTVYKTATGPTRQLFAASQKTMALESVRYEIATKGANEDQGQKYSGELKVTGTYDGHGGKPRLGAQAEGRVDLGKDGTYQAKLEGRQLENVSYGMLVEPPKNEVVDLLPLKDLWLKQDWSEMKDAQGRTLADYLKPLSKEQVKQLGEVMKKNPPISKVEKGKAEQIGNVKADHYRVTIDYDKLPEFLVNAAGIVRGQALNEEEKKMITDGLKDAKPEKNTPVDIWTTPDGIKKIQSHDELRGAGKTTGTLDTTVIFSDYNQTFDVQTPSPANTVDELERYASADADRDGLNNLMERYFKSDPKRADTDSDGNKDGAEVRAGYDPTRKGKAKLSAEQQHVAKVDKDLLGSDAGTALFSEAGRSSAAEAGPGAGSAGNQSANSVN